MNREYFRSINAYGGCACSLTSIISRNGRGPVRSCLHGLVCIYDGRSEHPGRRSSNVHYFWDVDQRPGKADTNPRLERGMKTVFPTPWRQYISCLFYINCTEFLTNIPLWPWSTTRLIPDSYVALHSLGRSSDVWDSAGDTVRLVMLDY
jgi:hypothetical protein